VTGSTEPSQPTEPTPPTRAERLHDEFRRKVWEDTTSGSENFDKYLITFSTGALALSLSFIKDIVPIKDAVWIPLLIVSWCFFIAATLVTLISFRISIRALEKMSPVLDDFYLNGKVDAFNKHLESWWTKAVDWSAYAGIFFFVVGLICTMIFVSENLSRANGMAEKESPQQGNPIRIDRIDFGCKPPAMTPITQNAKPEVKAKGNDLGKGVKPVPMTPVRQTPTPAPVPPCPAAPPKK